MSFHPTSAPVALLELGRLLFIEVQKGRRNQFRPSDEEKQLLKLLVTDKQFQLALNIYASTLDPDLVRLIGVVGYAQLCTAQYAIHTADLVRFLTDNEPADVIEVRKIISHLLVSKRLLLKPSDTLALGGDLLTFLAGGKGQPPLVMTDQDLEAYWRKAEAQSEKRAEKVPPIPTPKQLAAKIAHTVVGLDAQVRTLACRVTLHQRRAAMIRAGKDPGSPNESLLCLGPSGAGKTFIMSQAGRVCGLPFGAISSSDLTCEGYQGLGVDDAIKQVIVAARGNISVARFGICFFDEWDKKRVSGWEHGSRDVAGASVQQAVLRLMEGENHQVGGRKGTADWNPGNLDTNGMFFAFAGAYVGLEQLLGKNTTGAIGFGEPNANSNQQQFFYDALVDFGMIPEFVNRLTGILVFPEPTIPQLIEIANRGVIPAYKRLLAGCGTNIQVSDDGIKLMAESAQATKTFARGVKTVVARLIEDAVYEERTGLIHFDRHDVRQAIEAAGMGGDEATPVEVPPMREKQDDHTAGLVAGRG